MISYNAWWLQRPIQVEHVQHDEKFWLTNYVRLNIQGLLCLLAIKQNSWHPILSMHSMHKIIKLLQNRLTILTSGWLKVNFRRELIMKNLQCLLNAPKTAYEMRTGIHCSWVHGIYPFGRRQGSLVHKESSSNRCGDIFNTFETLWIAILKWLPLGNPV